MKHVLFWRDLEDDQSNWTGLHIEVPHARSSRPALSVLTGANARIKLVFNETSLLWATVKHGYHGAWVIRNALRSTTRPEHFPPISSADVERLAGKSQVEQIKGWCRFFIERMNDHGGGFLSSGAWLAQALLPMRAIPYRVDSNELHTWQFETQAPSGQLPGWQLNGQALKAAMNAAPVRWLDWWESWDSLVLLHDVDPHAGRLKWWRKKAREGALPPILLWYVRGLSAYVLIDGHCRLKAALDEEIPPTFIVLSEIHAWERFVCSTTQQRVVDSLLKQRLRKPKFDVNSMNRVLIKAFDDRPHLGTITHSWAGIREEREWMSEVTAHLKKNGQSDQLQKIIDRDEPDIN